MQEICAWIRDASAWSARRRSDMFRVAGERIAISHAGACRGELSGDSRTRRRRLRDADQGQYLDGARTSAVFVQFQIIRQRSPIWRPTVSHGLGSSSAPENRRKCRYRDGAHSRSEICTDPARKRRRLRSCRGLGDESAEDIAVTDLSADGCTTMASVRLVDMERDDGEQRG